MRRFIPSYWGRLLRAPQFLTSGTSYTPPPGCRAILVELLGGGGGGAGAPTAAVSAAAGGGGGGAAYASKYFNNIDGSSLTYAIGGGGAGGAAGANVGGDGGNTTFAALGITVTARGGRGAQTMAAASVTPDVTGIFQGYLSTNGDVNGAGGPTTPGIVLSATRAVSGNGGSTLWGGGGVGRASALAGGAGIGLGSGGGGGTVINGSAAVAGGNGADGAILVWEFS